MTIEPESIETIFDDDVTACAHDVEECGQGFIKSQALFEIFPNDSFILCLTFDLILL